MKYSVDKQEKYTVLNVNEEKIDSLIAPDLKSELVKLNAEGIKNIILDLEGVKYVDSYGLSAILIVNRLCENLGGTFVLTRISDHVQKLIQISQLDSVLNILPTLEEAVDAVFLDEIENDLESEGGSEE